MIRISIYYHIYILYPVGVSATIFSFFFKEKKEQKWKCSLLLWFKWNNSLFISTYQLICIFQSILVPPIPFSNFIDAQICICRYLNLYRWYFSVSTYDNNSWVRMIYLCNLVLKWNHFLRILFICKVYLIFMFDLVQVSMVHNYVRYMYNLTYNVPCYRSLSFINSSKRLYNIFVLMKVVTSYWVQYVHNCTMHES